MIFKRDFWIITQMAATDKLATNVHCAATCFCLRIYLSQTFLATLLYQLAISSTYLPNTNLLNAGQ
jgi:hypothetical protein